MRYVFEEQKFMYLSFFIFLPSTYNSFMPLCSIFYEKPDIFSQVSAFPLLLLRCENA